MKSRFIKEKFRQDEEGFEDAIARELGHIDERDNIAEEEIPPSFDENQNDKDQICRNNNTNNSNWASATSPRNA